MLEPGIRVVGGGASDYTVRIVHFDVDPGEGCDAIGGVVKTVIVPVAIAAMPKDFCFPKVLADNWDAYVQ